MVDQFAKGDVNRKKTLLGIGNDSDAEILRLLLNPTSKRLLVDSLNESVGHAAISNGAVSVGTSITRLITASTPCKRVIVHAVDGHIVVGGSDVIYTAATRLGVWIPRGNSITFNVENVNLLYARAAGTVRVTFVYEN